MNHKKTFYRLKPDFEQSERTSYQELKTLSANHLSRAKGLKLSISMGQISKVTCRLFATLNVTPTILLNRALPPCKAGDK